MTDLIWKVGDYQSTKCRLNCAHNFVAVESEPYVCDKSPCPRWSLGQSHCYYCNTNCSKLHDLELPKPASMVPALGCKCPMIVVASDPKPEGDKRKRMFGRPGQGIKFRAKSTGISYGFQRRFLYHLAQISCTSLICCSLGKKLFICQEANQ